MLFYIIYLVQAASIHFLVWQMAKIFLMQNTSLRPNVWPPTLNGVTRVCPEIPQPASYCANIIAAKLYVFQSA